MSLWQILLLAVIQGAAELLPVSSSAHVILAEKLLGLDPGAPDMTFLLVMLHTGTMGAAIIYFRKRWLQRLKASGKDFLYQIIIATGFTGVIGLGLKKIIEKAIEIVAHEEKGEIEMLFRNLPLIAAALFAVGLLILWAAKKDGPGGRPNLTNQDSIAIGVVQALCLPFRGFSRSGATISAALLRGISRETAEEYSFALSVALTPPVIFLELSRLLKHAHATGQHLPIHELLLPGAIGMVLALIAGLGALVWLSNWLEKGKWRFFGYYCLAAAIIAGGLASVGF
jgi:undecaprenyl-diphosphatase